MEKYDLAVIGSGPCGYVAGIRASQLGLKTCVFEGEEIGGVCLNQGCIPTKALLASGMAIHNVQRSDEFGINVHGYDIDFQKIQERKERIVKKLASGIQMLMNARKIVVVNKKAWIKDATHISAGDTEIEVSNILIGTGSLPFEIPAIPFDGIHVLSSSDLLELKTIPKSLIIIGGGVIGCELASIFEFFGSQITIVEMMQQLLPNEDAEVAKKLEQLFRKRGMKVWTDKKVEKIEKRDGGVKALLSNETFINAEKALVCIGRTPNYIELGIENIGIECDRGWIKVDGSFRTNIKNIYAAGDVKGGMLLAHVASKEGISAVEAMCGKEMMLDYNVIPNCIYTYPEIASVGLNEKTAKARRMNTRVRKFLFSAIGKSHILGETEGFIKLVVDSGTDKILGAQIIGHHAAELIAELSPCIQFGISSESLTRVIHAHPTLSEAVQEVSEAVHNRAIHSL